MGNKRTGHYYKAHEKEILRSYGITPQPLSGGGIEKKEDGETDTLLVQLKSTGGKQITIKKQDVEDLYYHAVRAHKTPVFCIEFIGEYVLMAVPATKDATKNLYKHFYYEERKNAKGTNGN